MAHVGLEQPPAELIQLLPPDRIGCRALVTLLSVHSDLALDSQRVLGHHLRARWWRWNTTIATAAAIAVTGFPKPLVALAGLITVREGVGYAPRPGPGRALLGQRERVPRLRLGAPGPCQLDALARGGTSLMGMLKLEILAQIRLAGFSHSKRKERRKDGLGYREGLRVGKDSRGPARNGAAKK